VPGENVVGVKMPPTRGRTERPRAALLQSGAELRETLRRIGGSLRSPRSGGDGGAGEIPPWISWSSNPRPSTRMGDTVRRAVFLGRDLPKKYRESAKVPSAGMEIRP
jgi:hypothetical protein